MESKLEISRSELAVELGVSLGKARFCLKALIEKGLLKATNFRNGNKKAAYMYLLTPKGLGEKPNITIRLLKSKVEEYEVLRNDIEQLKKEAEQFQSRAINFS